MSDTDLDEKGLEAFKRAFYGVRSDLNPEKFDPLIADALRAYKAADGVGPAAWQMKPPLDGGDPNWPENQWRHCDAELAAEMASRGWETRALYAAPRPSRSRDEVVELTDRELTMLQAAMHAYPRRVRYSEPANQDIACKLDGDGLLAVYEETSHSLGVITAEITPAGRAILEEQKP